jgi:hypothetical protein
LTSATIANAVLYIGAFDGYLVALSGE